jgi:ferredoxin--NADP+ reductase
MLPHTSPGKLLLLTGGKPGLSGNLYFMHSHILSQQIITHSEELAEGVFLISFKRDFTFLPGQVIGISMEKDGPRRLYSICSGAEEDEVQILFNVVDQGYLTPRLSDLSRGDKIWISEPRGSFLFDPEPAIWIASGTGIAPFYSMFRSGKFQNKVLIHGERYLEKFYFYDEFSEQLGENYLRCCSGEESDGVFSGRVTEYLRNASSLPVDFKYYLCGRAEMVVETRDILIERGIPFDRIISEIYF